MKRMQPRTRRIVQAVLYEFFAVLMVAPAFAFLFDHPLDSSFLLSIVVSTIALVWNYVFNLFFEAWESRQEVKGRSPKRRLMHGLGFEGGLAIMVVPLIAVWLDVSLMTALIADITVLAFFFFYTIGFTWTFDKIFGLPESAQ